VLREKITLERNMKLRMGMLALLLAATACDQATAPQASDGYTTTYSVAIRNARTGQLEAAPPSANASIASGSYTEPLIIPLNASGVGFHATAGRVNGVYVASDGHKHQVSAVYHAGGGPPAVVQNYLDGKLNMVTQFSWARTNEGWVRTKSVTSIVQPGAPTLTYTILGTVTAVTEPCNKYTNASCGMPRAVLAHPLMQRFYGLMEACASPANAQGLVNMSWTFCRTEWIVYGAASLGVAVAGVALMACPECGITEAAFSAAMGGAAKALDSLIECMLSDPNGGMRKYTTGSGGFSGAGIGSLGDGDSGIVVWPQ
jgi:hypothetical protein